MKRILSLFALVVLASGVITPELSAGYVDSKFMFSVVFTSDYQSVYKDDKGYTVIIGEVQNTSDIYSVKDVRIDVNFYDDVNPKPLEIVKGSTILNVIPPLGKSPFMIRSNSPNSHITQASVSMSGFNGADPKSDQQSVELSNIVIDSTLRFSGVLKNNGNPINNANVYLAFYDMLIPIRIIGVATIPIGHVESNDIKKFSFNEKIPMKSAGFFVFSESDVSYSVPANFDLRFYADMKVEESSRWNVTYETYGRQFFDNPLVCTYHPDWGQSLSKNEKEKRNGLVESAKLAVEDWQSALQENEKNQLKDNWRIDFKVLTHDITSDNLQKECNIIIKFEDRPSEQDELFKTIGKTDFNYDDTGMNLITIYYNSIQTCVTQDDHYIYHDQCYDYNIFRTSKQLKNTITHEIGHSLGLGHYQSDNEKINKAWATGNKESESIMTVFAHDNQNLQKIKPIDVEKVKTMYGSNGFKSISISQIISNPKPILDTKSYGQHVIPDWVKRNAKWWADGTITDKDFVAGIQFLAQQKIIKVGQTVQPTTITSNIPSWIKNNAKWWSEDKISEDEFLRGIEFLASNGIIKVR